MGPLPVSDLAKPTQAAPSALVRLQDVLERQSGLIDTLRNRLQPVSSGSLAQDAPIPGIHIGDLIDAALNNNAELENMIESLVI